MGQLSKQGFQLAPLSHFLEMAWTSVSDVLPPTIVPSRDPIRGEMYMRPICKGLNPYVCGSESSCDIDSDKTSIKLTEIV